MRNAVLILILMFFAACSSQRLDRKIHDPSWDALADETYLRWDNQRLKAASPHPSVVECYQGNVRETLDLYRKEYLKRKDEPYYWLHVGNCYFMDEKWTKAEFFYRLAMEEARSNSIKSVAMNNLGLVHFRHEQWEKGKELLRKAMALAPSYKVPPFNLSQLYLQFGLYDKAIETLHAPAIRGRQDIDFYFSLANAYLFKGDLKKAREHFDKIPTEHFQREDIASTYALYLIKIGDHKGAEKIMGNRERSGVPEVTAIAQKIETLLDQRTKGE